MYINKTTHHLKVERKDGTILEIPAASHSMRITDVKMNGKEHDGIPINNVRYVFSGLPDEEKDVYYIVSKLVAYNIKRKDFISPDTGPTCIKINGNVDTIRGFVSYPRDD